jgi:hypothetical protein
MSTELVQKSSKKYECICCDYSTSRKSQYDRHLLTDKHKNTENTTNSNKKVPKGSGIFVCECGQKYKDRTGLWRHKKKCVVNESQIQPLEINTLTNLVLDLVKSNQELQQQMLEVCKNGIMNNTNNNIANISNCNNKSFNLQFFLNETCKDALNMKDFIDSIQIKLSDLENMGKLGFVNGLSNIIIERLNALDVHMRPIHCTDTKRDTVYTKEQNQWTKEEADLKTVRRFIQSVAKKNTQNIGLFRNKHPDCMDSRSRNSDVYNKIVMETYGGYGNNDYDSENKIILKLIKEIAIDKSL